MKRWPWVACSLLVVAIGIAAVFFRASSGEAPMGTRNPPPGRGIPLGVDDLMRNVERYRKGSVLVEGIVSLATPKDGTLTLIDTGEFERCGLGCAKLMLPVRWNGSMPAVKEKVRLEGEIEDAGGKLVFVAKSVARPGAGGAP